MSRRLAMCAALAATTVLPLRAATLRVVPDGQNSDAPLRQALLEARALRASDPEVVVEVSGGRYELAQPLEFGEADSGITLRAAAGQRPVLSGGRRLRGWIRQPATPGLWTLDLPEVREGRWYFHQLFVNGVRAQRARTPNKGYFRTSGRLGTGRPITLPFRTGDVRPEWAGQRDARLVMLMKWTDLHVPIESVNAGPDGTTGVAVLPGGPRPDWMDEADARYWIENVPEALDAPGEWRLDRATGVLHYLAPPGVNPDSLEVVAPRLTELVRVQGRPGRPVTQLRLQGLSFVEADYAMPEQGLISPQAAVPVPGTARIEHAESGLIEDCHLDNLGGYGIELGRGVRSWRVVGNTLQNLGAGGIRIGVPDGRTDAPADANHSHAITDNTLRALGRVFAPSVGILIFHSGTNRIAHNHISDLYYTGISVGWTWGYQESPCRGHQIEFNLVEQVGQGRLSDMGGIYTLGPQPGTVIRNNVFRDIESYGYGGWGMYTDEGSSGIILENNVAYRCKSAGFHQHYGRDNVVQNNLIAFNREHELMRTRSEAHRSFVFSRNVVIWDSGDLLGSQWKGSTNEFLLDRNVYFDTRLGNRTAEYRFAGETWEAWRRRGQDLHSLIADPGLRDPGRPELGLSPQSPAFAVGFQPIDLEGLGPRPAAGRD